MRESGVTTTEQMQKDHVCCGWRAGWRLQSDIFNTWVAKNWVFEYERLHFTPFCNWAFRILSGPHSVLSDNLSIWAAMCLTEF